VRLYLYDEGTCGSLRPDDVADDLRRITGLEVEVRPEFIAHSVERRRPAAAGSGGAATQFASGYPDTVAAALVGARVHDPLRRLQPERAPSPVELAAERRALQTPGRTSAGILYDGARVQWLLSELLPADADDDCHIAITARLVGTWMPEDRRWHAHASLYGHPSIISTTGLVHAPARPREYYQAQQLATTRMVPREMIEAELEQRLSACMLVADDPRMTRVVAGYALQAVAFHLTGSAFCTAPTCPLYNARRQEELIRAHCSEESGLCEAHRVLFSQVGEGARG
jgi:hypothetical protein